MVRDRYFISNSNLDYIDFEAERNQGLLTISRLPVEFVEYPFITTTHIGSYLLACQTVINGIPLVLAHSKHDIAQHDDTVKQSYEILSSHSNVVWIADFMGKQISIMSYKDVGTAAGNTNFKMLLRSDKIKSEETFCLENKFQPGLIKVFNFTS